MGYELNYVLRQYKDILNQLDICAVPLHSCWGQFKAGQLISFDDKFRTKNVPGLDDYISSTFHLSGSLNRDPQLYLKQGDEKFILTLDPKWLATTTSFVNFRMGWVDVAGLAVVKYSDENKTIATPYVIGTPKNDFWDMLSF